MGDLYGKVMPASKKQINDKTEYIKRQTDKLEKKIENIKSEVSETKKQLIQQQEDCFNKTEWKINELQKHVNDIESSVHSLNNSLNKLSNSVHLMDLQEKKIFRSTSESVWAHIFHDTIEGSEWLKNKTFYPGRWAAGYPFLYALYRSLNDFRPKSVLELGLGQTTRMIGQYAAYQKECSHIVTEHDGEWIDIFKKGFELSSSTEILKLDIEKKSYYETEPATAYVNFVEKLKGKKFDLISIDAPFGGDHLEYSRMDILQLVPECLNKDFVIFLDDYNRKGEQNMIKKLEEILEANHIAYTIGKYCGNKDTFMVASENLKFLCTM